MTAKEIANEKALAVATYLRDQEGVPEVKCFSLILILAIAGFVLQLMTFMRTKKKSTEETLAIMQNPGILQRWELRRQLRKHFKGQYPELQPKILKGLQVVAQGVKHEEIQQIYKESTHDS
jgi:hypothetical protein